MTTRPFVSLALITALSLGCATEDDTGTDNDTERLERFRQAIPAAGRLSAPAAEATTSSALGDPAIYPTVSAPLVFGINGSVVVLVGVLRAIVMTPPTVFNSDTQEYVWGPYPSDDGVGYVAAYIRDTGTDEDFRYHYALLRGASNDLATLTPVILGGGTPDPNDEDRGVGLTLWDFEADLAFRAEHDPAFDPDAPADRGRFVTVFGAMQDASAPENQANFVVSVFRDFIPKDKPEDAPVDLDYFYGRYITPEHVLDFIDYEANVDVSEPKDGVAEDVGVRMAFLDEGTGRAEADAINGSMEANQAASVIECWDTSINQTFISFEIREEGQVTQSATDGASASCGLFEATLDELEIPSLQDIDPEMLEALDHVASTGSFE
jgi:hypothetical protein